MYRSSKFSDVKISLGCVEYFSCCFAIEKVPVFFPLNKSDCIVFSFLYGITDIALGFGRKVIPVLIPFSVVMKPFLKS